MLSVGTVSTITLVYLGLLFAVAYYADEKRKRGESITANSWVYSLSLAVHYTSWTIYGVVGLSAGSGVSFLSLYLGNTLMAFSWWLILRKMVRISKEQHITSIADFISSRYGKSPLLGGIVTLFSTVIIIPFIALQLKAIAYTFDILTVSSGSGPFHGTASGLAGLDTAFVAAVFLGIFGILFGARHLDASERHEGLVAAVAMQSVVKLAALVSVGLFMTYGLFNGFSDIFNSFVAHFPEKRHLFLLGTPQAPYSTWFTLLCSTMAWVMFQPRQFHVMVIENSQEEHVRDAMWIFPAYTFLITLFVLPIALGAVIISGGDTTMSDFFVLTIPLQAGHPWLATLVYIGGFSAGAGMVMVEAVVLSTMILNQLIVPLIVHLRIGGSDMSTTLLNLKRIGIMGVVFLGYLYYLLVGELYSLINIGIISLIAASQFVPSMIGGLYWKKSSREGALLGLVLGFLVWFHTLVVPMLVKAGLLDDRVLHQGPFGLSFLRPLQLFGMTDLEMLPHSLFWSMLFNVGAFIALSLLTEPSERVAEQAVKFVDVFESHEEPLRRKRMSRAPAIVEFVDLMAKFIGEKQAHAAIAQYLGDKEIDARGSLSEYELPVLKRYTEKVLAGSVGAASAGVIVESYMAARGSQLEDVFDIFGTVTLSRTAGREQLGLLYEAARVVASKADLQAILDNILDHIQQQFKFDTCIVRVVDEEKGRLVLLSQKGMSAEHLVEADREVDMETYAGAAFLNNHPEIINDTEVMDKPLSTMVIRREGIKSFAHVPITIEGQPVGVLSAFSKSMKGIFTEEFIQLFNSLAGQLGIALRNARQAEKLIQVREHEKEMQIARGIQSGLLPAASPHVEGIALAGICVPAREVGGDYYDYLPTGSDAVDLIIADVSGHNVGAALIMTEVRTFIHAEANSIRNPRQIMNALNEFLYEDLSRAELFITMFYLNYDSVSKKLIFANAGHNRPILLRVGNGGCEFIDAEGLILGIKRKVAFEQKQVQLQPGDILLLYTDGIVEAANQAGELFGEERLCQVLQDCHRLSPQQIIDNLLGEARSFAGSHTFVDDVSLVLMRVVA